MMEYKGCNIEIEKCKAAGWHGYWEYCITRPGSDHRLVGRSGGSKREVLFFLKSKIDSGKFFPIVQPANTASTPTNGGQSPAENSSTPAAIRG